MADYKTDISIWQMVQDNLPFIVPDATSEPLAGRFIYRTMEELNHCFNKDDSLIGDDSNYSIEERSLIADVASLYFLLRLSLENSQGSVSSGGGTAAGGTFLKRAKAGSAEVEYGQLTGATAATVATNGSFDYDKLWDKFIGLAMRKGSKLGCDMSLCNACSSSEIVADTGMPLIVISNCRR